MTHILSKVAKQGDRRIIPIPQKYYDLLPIGTEVEIVRVKTTVERLDEQGGD